jgi:hypothetical protein
MSARKKKGVPIILRWQQLVADAARADDSATRPALSAVCSVALVRSLRADADGGSCFPSVEGIAAGTGLARETVRKVDAWLVGHDLMVRVRRRKGNVAEYRLTLPQVGSEDCRPSGAELALEQSQVGSDDCRPDDKSGAPGRRSAGRQSV